MIVVMTVPIVAVVTRGGVDDAGLGLPVAARIVVVRTHDSAARFTVRRLGRDRAAPRSGMPTWMIARRRPRSVLQQPSPLRDSSGGDDCRATVEARLEDRQQTARSVKSSPSPVMPCPFQTFTNAVIAPSGSPARSGPASSMNVHLKRVR